MEEPRPPINLMGHRFVFRRLPDGGTAFIDDLPYAVKYRRELVTEGTAFELWERKGRKMILRKSGRLPID